MKTGGGGGVSIELALRSYVSLHCSLLRPVISDICLLRVLNSSLDKGATSVIVCL